jgi:hypothetical protein
MMALKGNKLQHNDIYGIRGFAMAYKGPAKFAMAFTKLSLHLLSWQLSSSCRLHVHRHA